MIGAVGGITSSYAAPAWPALRAGQTEESGTAAAPETAATAQSDTSGQPSTTGTGVDELTPDEEQQVQELKQRDSVVRRHEAAHMAAGGGITGGASFEYEVGPDGRSYAVGGEVGISTSEGSTPQATIQKMQTVKRAALAPADPSGQDRAVAAAAAAQEAQARLEMMKEASGQRQSADPSSAIKAYANSSGAMPGQNLDTSA
jgi:hypothetical protein